MIKLINILSEIKIISKITPEVVTKLYDEFYKINHLDQAWDEFLNILDEYYKKYNSYSFFKLILKLPKPDLYKLYSELLNLKRKYINNINEIKIIHDPTKKIIAKLYSLKRGDKVQLKLVDGEVIKGEIFHFKTANKNKDGVLIIRTPGQYFHRDTSIYVDYATKVDNRTSQEFYNLKKI